MEPELESTCLASGSLRTDRHALFRTRSARPAALQVSIKNLREGEAQAQRSKGENSARSCEIAKTDSMHNE